MSTTTQKGVDDKSTYEPIELRFPGLWSKVSRLSKKQILIAGCILGSIATVLGLGIIFFILNSYYTPVNF